MEYLSSVFQKKKNLSIGGQVQIYDNNVKFCHKWIFCSHSHFAGFSANGLLQCSILMEIYTDKSVTRSNTILN